MTVIAQDDHLTAGAWAACDRSYSLRLSEMRIKNLLCSETSPFIL